MLLAAVLSAVVMGGYIYLAPRPEPSQQEAAEVIATPSQPAVPNIAPQSGAEAAVAAEPSETRGTDPAIQLVEAINEQTVKVETDAFVVEFTNRGATVKSWQLRRFRDSLGEPSTWSIMTGPLDSDAPSVWCGQAARRSRAPTKLCSPSTQGRARGERRKRWSSSTQRTAPNPQELWIRGRGTHRPGRKPRCPRAAGRNGTYSSGEADSETRLRLATQRTARPSISTTETLSTHRPPMPRTSGISHSGPFPFRGDRRPVLHCGCDS